MKTHTRDQWIDFARRVTAWHKPLLVSHAKPDGDAIGSLVAMRAMLRTLGRAPLAILFDPIPSRYDLFHDYDALPIWNQDIRVTDVAACDAVIILDTCTHNQLTPIADWLRGSALPRLVVDHHVTRDSIADHYLIDESAAATCLILYEWARAVAWEIPSEAATALFIGVAMDTGWFRHANTDARVLSASADLVKRGAHPHRLFQAIFQHESAARVKLLGQALHSLELLCEDRLAVMSVTTAAMNTAGATPADTEDIVNEPLRIDSVVVSVLLVEQDDRIRVSFRSKPPTSSPASVDIDVAAVAQRFGGGGHRRAAGARVEGDLPHVRDSVVTHLRRLLAT